MCIATQGPAGDGAHQGLLVAQTLDEVGDELRQIGHHALHTAWVVTGTKIRGLLNNSRIIHFNIFNKYFRTVVFKLIMQILFSRINKIHDYLLFLRLNVKSYLNAHGSDLHYTLHNFLNRRFKTFYSIFNKKNFLKICLN